MPAIAESCRIQFTEMLYKSTLPRSAPERTRRDSSFESAVQRLPSVVARKLGLEPFPVSRQIDSAKRHQLTLDPCFPLAINLYDFPEVPGSIQLSWHERLEIFCPLSGPGAFRIGDHLEPFDAGDILLIDNLRLHCADRFQGPNRLGLVVVFNPELLAAPGALPCDLWLLRPFHHLEQQGCLRLAWGKEHSHAAWECLTRLIEAEMEQTAGPASQARQKLALSELLIVLQRAFSDRIVEQNMHESRRDRLRRLAPLFDFLAEHLSEPIRVESAARLLGMSMSYFRRFFRNATGLTFSAYVDSLRLSRAYQLLLEGEFSLAQIADETGYCDQCHLSSHFRRRFGTSPGRIRARQRESDATSAAPLGEWSAPSSG